MAFTISNHEDRLHITHADCLWLVSNY